MYHNRYPNRQNIYGKQKSMPPNQYGGHPPPSFIQPQAPFSHSNTPVSSFPGRGNASRLKNQNMHPHAAQRGVQGTIGYDNFGTNIQQTRIDAGDGFIHASSYPVPQAMPNAGFMENEEDIADDSFMINYMKQINMMEEYESSGKYNGSGPNKSGNEKEINALNRLYY